MRSLVQGQPMDERRDFARILSTLLLVVALATSAFAAPDVRVTGVSVGWRGMFIPQGGWCPIAVSIASGQAGVPIEVQALRMRGEETIRARTRFVSAVGETTIRLMLPPRVLMDEKQTVIALEIVAGDSLIILQPFDPEIRLPHAGYARLIVAHRDSETPTHPADRGYLLPEELPRNAAMYEGINELILRGISPDDLDPALKNALLHAVARGMILALAPSGTQLSLGSFADRFPPIAGARRWPRLWTTGRPPEALPPVEGIVFGRDSGADTPQLASTSTFGRGRIAAYAVDPLDPAGEARLAKVEWAFTGHGYDGQIFHGRTIEALAVRNAMTPWRLPGLLQIALFVLLPLLFAGIFSFVIRHRPASLNAVSVLVSVVVALVVLLAWKFSGRTLDLTIIDAYPSDRIAIEESLEPTGEIRGQARIACEFGPAVKLGQPLSYGFDASADRTMADGFNAVFFRTRPVEDGLDASIAYVEQDGVNGVYDIRIRNGAARLRGAFIVGFHEWIPVGTLAPATECVVPAWIGDERPADEATERLMRLLRPVRYEGRFQNLALCGLLDDGRILIIHSPQMGVPTVLSRGRR